MRGVCVHVRLCVSVCVCVCLGGWGAQCGSQEAEAADSEPFISYHYSKSCAERREAEQQAECQMSDKMSQTQTRPPPTSMLK